MVCSSSAFFRFSSRISFADSDATPGACTGVDLRLPHPRPQRLGTHPQPGGDGRDRGALRVVVIA